MNCKSAVAAGLINVGSISFGTIWPWLFWNWYCCPVFGLKICTGWPSLYVAPEKSPLRSPSVGTVENASYGELPRDPFHPPKKNHLFPPLNILGMFSGPPTFTPKRGWL